MTARIAALVALSLGGVAATAGAALAQGTITGRVTDKASGQPLDESRVQVVGTALYGSTNLEGRFTIRNVPAGSYTLRALRVGYVEQKQSATVTNGEASAADFAMERTVIKLQEVVTTATGTQRRVELGNAVANIDAAKILETAPVSNVQDVLAARTPGVTVTSTSQVGGGSRVRIRGNSSLNLSNEPIYIIDGVRMTSTTGSPLFTGGAQPNRANDINPDDIESMEIVKGPSAATLYGTDAANGVILITTKRGRVGPTQWNVWTEGGLIKDNSDYDYNYTLAGHNPTDPTKLLITGECTLPKVAAGTCAADSVRKYSPLRDSNASPLGTGYRSKFGSSAAGGSNSVRYFLSAEREQEVGVQTLPKFEQARFDTTLGYAVPSNVLRPNQQYKYSYRANVNTSPSSALDIGVSAFYNHSNTQFATESNATAGIGSQIFGGKGYPENGTVSGLGTSLHGYRAWTPGYTYQEQNQQLVNRTILSANASWRPLTWMQNRANIGIDYASQYSGNLLRNGEGPPVNSTYRLGFKDDYRTAIRNFSFDLASSGIWNPREALSFRTTVGAQYVNYQYDQNEAFGQTLAPGTVTTNSAATPAANERTDLSKTLGVFGEEQVSVRDRLFLTAALRTDQNSAFGTDFQRVFYPKFSVSYLISEESFFPKPGWLTEFRLRTAYGASGVQPGPNDALRYFRGISTSYKGTDLPAVTDTALGNPKLKPERTTEYEGGIDVRAFGTRAELQLTYYSKTTHAALIDAIVAPSAGSASLVKRNLGSVKNAGLEALLTTQVINRDRIGVDVTLTAATNANRLVSMGGVPTQVNTTWRAQAGYPLFGFWARPIYKYEDKDHNGILTYNADPAKNEVFVGDSSVYRGYSSPRYTATLVPGVELFGRRLRLASLFEYKGGFKHYNNTERIRCVSRQNCNGLMNLGASLEEQAMVVATLDHPAKTLDGFFQDADFVRWRELSATLQLPALRTTPFLRTRSASLNFAVRNLHLWTKYRGLDPEIDRLASETTTNGVNAPGEEFQTLGIPTYYTLRLNLGF